jgi:hypothetical protein
LRVTALFRLPEVAPVHRRQNRVLLGSHGCCDLLQPIPVVRIKVLGETVN